MSSTDWRKRESRSTEKKCTFASSSVKFLGVIVTAQGTFPDPDKVEAIQAMPAPEDTAGVRRLLGLVSHIDRFLLHVSEVTAPLRALLIKNSVWNWGNAQQSAFSRLKQLLCSDLSVARYNVAYKTVVSAAASSFGLGVALLQEQPSGGRFAVDFAFRALTPTEQRYSQTEKGSFAMIWAVLRCDQCLRGLNFTVETDHLRLVDLLGGKYLELLPPMIQRMLIKLMRYQFGLQHVPGKLIATADTLSRAPCSRSSSLTVRSMEHFVDEVRQGHSSSLRYPAGGSSTAPDGGWSAPQSSASTTRDGRTGGSYPRSWSLREGDGKSDSF